MRSRLVTENVWKTIHEAAHGRRKYFAAVAYVSNASLLSDFRPGDVVVCNAGKRALTAGATHPDALKRLVERGIHVYSSDRLHAKVFVFPTTAIVGSANASGNSVKSLDEAAVQLTQPSLVAEARRFVEKLRKGSVVVDAEYIEEHARKWYRAPRGGGGGGSRKPEEGLPNIQLFVESYRALDMPRAVQLHYDNHLEQQCERVGRATDWYLDASWGPRPRWKDGDWVLWVCVSDKIPSAEAPMQVFDRTKVPGNSGQYITWYRALKKQRERPWDAVEGHVLAASKYQILFGKRVTTASAIEAVFSEWGLYPPSD